MADWSVLPSDILGVIALKLNIIEDFIYFSWVCTSWNHVSSMVKPEWSRGADKPTPPWLLLAEPEPEHEYTSRRKIFSISKNKCYDMMLPEITEKRCWGSSYGWIVMHDFKKNVNLFNPITKAQLSLPSLYQLPTYKDTLIPNPNPNPDPDPAPYEEHESEEEEYEDEEDIDMK